jgi:hypothetical protein
MATGLALSHKLFEQIIKNGLWPTERSDNHRFSKRSRRRAGAFQRPIDRLDVPSWREEDVEVLDVNADVNHNH